MLAWQLHRNIENSFKDFLDAQISTDGVTDVNGDSVPVRVGEKVDNNWTLPCIVIHVDSETDPKLFIGSNFIDQRPLIIIDIYATNGGERSDIANWLTQEIKNGFSYYTYSPNLSDIENPTKVLAGTANVDFLTNGRVNLGDNIDLIDAHRHQITVNTFITSS